MWSGVEGRGCRVLGGVWSGGGGGDGGVVIILSGVLVLV